MGSTLIQCINMNAIQTSCFKLIFLVPLLESVAIPVVRALCECTFTVSVSYFYDFDDYFGPSSQMMRVTF